MTKATKSAAKTAAAAPALTPASQTTKLQAIVTLLQRPQGASLAELMVATAWQAHSVRGALSRQLRGKLEMRLVSEKRHGVRVYHLAQGVGA